MGKNAYWSRDSREHKCSNHRPSPEYYTHMGTKWTCTTENCGITYETVRIPGVGMTWALTKMTGRNGKS